MALIEAPDIAGLLDAMGRHDAADTVRWADAFRAEADAADLTDEVDGANRERDDAIEAAEKLQRRVTRLQKAVAKLKTQKGSAA